MSVDPLKSLDRKKMREWMKKKVKQKIKFSRLSEENTSDADDSDDEVSDNDN